SCITIRLPLCPTLFPYTTLFRSDGEMHVRVRARVGFAKRVGCRNVAGRCGLGSEAFEIYDRAELVVHAHAQVELARRHIHEARRSEEHTSELQSRENLVCRLLLE